MTKQDRITKLQQYLENLNQQLASPTDKRKGQVSFLQWVQLEVRRTKSTIESLKL